MDYKGKFGFDEFNDGGRVHINLSEHAWLIIHQDEENFWHEDKKVSDSGFLNRIFFNFYQNAEASLYTRTEQKRNEFDSLFPDNDTKVPTGDDLSELKLNEVRIEERRIMKRQMLDSYIDGLKAKVESYPKGSGFKFKLNKENTNLVYELLEGEYYQGNLGKYLKAVFEEYTRLPTYLREQYYFKEIYDDFNDALDNQKQLKIFTQKRIKADGSNEIVERKFLFSPYKVMQDQAMNFNYLVGYSQEIDKDGNKLDKRITSYRLSRIAKASIMLSLSGFISKQDKERIDEEVKDKGVAFLVGDLEDIVVRFTKKGLEHYKKQLYMRPNIERQIDQYTYAFRCTSTQIINYFFKFGMNVEILEPRNLRETFIKRYKTALEVYEINN